MKKSNGYYMMSYLKNNWLVLLCELVIVLLLSLICTLLLGGQPTWIGPTLAVTAYLLAEIRFMMAYVATVARKAQEDEAEDEPDEDEAEPNSEDELPATEPVVTAPEQPQTVEQPAAEEAQPTQIAEPAVAPEAVQPEAAEEIEQQAVPETENAETDEFPDMDAEDDLPTSKMLDLGEL